MAALLAHLARAAGAGRVCAVLHLHVGEEGLVRLAVPGLVLAQVDVPAVAQPAPERGHGLVVRRLAGADEARRLDARGLEDVAEAGRYVVAEGLVVARAAALGRLLHLESVLVRAGGEAHGAALDAEPACQRVRKHGRVHVPNVRRRVHVEDGRRQQHRVVVGGGGDAGGGRDAADAARDGGAALGRASGRARGRETQQAQHVSAELSSDAQCCACAGHLLRHTPEKCPHDVIKWNNLYNIVVEKKTIYNFVDLTKLKPL